MTFEVPRTNILIALFLALSFVFVYARYQAPARTVEIQKAFAVVVKDKPAHNDSSGAGNPSSSQSDEENNDGSSDQDDDDASPDPNEVYQA